jgi:hypothetical protein
MKKPTPTKAQARVERKHTRAELRAKRELLRDAKRAQREALKLAREHIRKARKELGPRIAHWREINRQILKRAIEGERHAAAAERLQLRTGIKGRAHEMQAAANAAIDADLKHLRWLGKLRHKPASSARVKAGLLAAEKRHEADEFVRNELPVELHAAWELHKHKIKATPRTPRWEMALDYFHDHPEAVAEANAAELERSIQASIAREHEERQALDSPKRARQFVSSAARELVPEHYGKRAAKRASSKPSKRKTVKPSKRASSKPAKLPKPSKMKPPKKAKAKARTERARKLAADVPF